MDNSPSQRLAYAIVEREPHGVRRYAVLLEHADGFRHPIRRFEHKVDAERYRDNMLRRHLHGYEFNGIWTESQLVLARVQECTVVTCFR